MNRFFMKAATLLSMLLSMGSFPISGWAEEGNDEAP